MTSGEPPRRPFSFPHTPSSGRPWSDLETSHLISAYDQVWHSLDRGHLRSNHWDHVAAIAANRSGPHQPSRTGTQCRHKMEKLRKRYREERQLGAHSSHWPHFEQIDRMERGAPPIVEDEEEDEVEGCEGELGAVVRRFEEGFLRMEKRRAEVMSEMEREWMRMEERRTEMLVEAERWIVDSIARVFHSSKKARRSPDN